MQLLQKQIARRYINTIANAKLLNFVNNEIIYIEESDYFYIAKTSALAENLPYIIVCNDGKRLLRINEGLAPGSPPTASLYEVGRITTNQTITVNTPTTIIFNSTDIANSNFSLNTGTGVVTALKNFNYLEVYYNIVSQKTSGAAQEVIIGQVHVNGTAKLKSSSTDYMSDTSRNYSTISCSAILTGITNGTTIDLRVSRQDGAGNIIILADLATFRFKEIL